MTRPAEAPVGKVLPTRLTPRGRRKLEKATAAVRSVEMRMLGGLTEAEQASAFRVLRRMVRSLREGNDDAKEPRAARGAPPGAPSGPAAV